MTVRATLLALVFAAGLSLSGLVNAAFISGVWQGDANFDAQGKFSDCTMTAQASSSVIIGFIISKSFDWGLILPMRRKNSRSAPQRLWRLSSMNGIRSRPSPK
jgi:hypothetical protein